MRWCGFFPAFFWFFAISGAGATASHLGPNSNNSNNSNDPNDNDAQLCESYLAQNPSVKRGALFSGILLGHTQIASRWATLYMEAKALFPHLKFNPRVNLHFTLVYVGKDWNYAELEKNMLEMMPAPEQDQLLTPSLVRMGRFQQVVAFEFEGITDPWKTKVIQARQTLTARGFCKSDLFDSNLRLHMTLAQAPQNGDPTEEQKTELAAFQAWLPQQPGMQDFTAQHLKIPANTPVDLLLATGGDYLTVSEWKREHLGIHTPTTHPSGSNKSWLP